MSARLPSNSPVGRSPKTSHKPKKVVLPRNTIELASLLDLVPSEATSQRNQTWGTAGAATLGRFSARQEPVPVAPMSVRAPMLAARQGEAAARGAAPGSLSARAAPKRSLL